VPFFTPQIPHEPAWDRTWTSMVRDRRLTASFIEISVRFFDVLNVLGRAVAGHCQRPATTLTTNFHACKTRGC